MVQETNGTSDEGSGERERAPEIAPRKRERKTSQTVKIPLIDGNLIRRDGDAALVEYFHEGDIARCTIPFESISKNQCSLEDLFAGAPYGETWSDVDGISPAMEQAFYQRGIWTKQNLLKLSLVARGVLQRELVVPLFKQLLKYSQK